MREDGQLIVDDAFPLTLQRRRGEINFKGAHGTEQLNTPHRSPTRRREHPRGTQTHEQCVVQGKWLKQGSQLAQRIRGRPSGGIRLNAEITVSHPMEEQKGDRR